MSALDIQYDTFGMHNMSDAEYTTPITHDHFKETLGRTSIVVINFYAPWCHWCDRACFCAKHDRVCILQIASDGPAATKESCTATASLLCQMCLSHTSLIHHQQLQLCMLLASLIRVVRVYIDCTCCYQHKVSKRALVAQQVLAPLASFSPVVNGSAPFCWL